MNKGVSIPVLMDMGMPVMVLMRMRMVMLMPILLQMHIKIIRIQSTYIFPPKVQMISAYPQAFKGMFQHMPVRSQVQKRTNGHIPADSRITFQIQYFSHFILPPICLFEWPDIRPRIRCQYSPLKSRWHRNSAWSKEQTVHESWPHIPPMWGPQ